MRDREQFAALDAEPRNLCDGHASCLDELEIREATAFARTSLTTREEGCLPAGADHLSFH